MESRDSRAGDILVDPTAIAGASLIKKPGICPAFSSPCLSRRLLTRALAMFGLFYFPNPIAFLQHSSVAPRAKLVFL
jgi:hypothetical protein